MRARRGLGLGSFVADVHAASLVVRSGGVWDRYRTNHGKTPAFVMDLVLGLICRFCSSPLS